MHSHDLISAKNYEKYQNINILILINILIINNILILFFDIFCLPSLIYDAEQGCCGNTKINYISLSLYYLIHYLI